MISQILGMTDVASPSFAIHHRYENTRKDVIDHLDLYRLQDEDDLESTGFWDLFMQTKAIVAIEWADRLNQDVLPLNWYEIRIHIEPLEGTERKIKIEIQD